MERDLSVFCKKWNKTFEKIIVTTKVGVRPGYYAEFLCKEVNCYWEDIEEKYSDDLCGSREEI